MKKNNVCKKCGAKLAKKNKSGFCKDHYERVPWNKGKVGLQTAWNKGVKRTESEIAKMKANQWDRSGNKNPMYGRTHSEEAKESIRQAVIKRLTSSKHSIETKRKMRIAAIEYIRNTKGLNPRYNKDACEFFDLLNKELSLKGVHAENGGEHYVKELGYWIDFIDFDNKIIIENNEKKHYSGKRKEKTFLKKLEIKSFYCDFLYIITNIPRTGKYDRNRTENIFKEEIERVRRTKKRIFTRGDKRF